MNVKRVANISGNKNSETCKLKYLDKSIWEYCFSNYLYFILFNRFYEAKDDGKWPSQCYLFKSCGRKVETATFDCSINAENTLEVKPFIISEQECEMKCQEVRKAAKYSSFYRPYILYIKI